MRKPSVYFSQPLFDEICALLAEGRNLREICRMEGMPTAAAVLSWAQSDPELDKHYARARERGYAVMADDIVDIADNDKSEQARLRVDTRKWLMSKCLPKIYGDKQSVEGKFTVDWAQVCQEAADRWKKEEGL
jgi:hypothetical protein